MKTNHIKSMLLAGCLIAASALLMFPAETAALSVDSVSFGSPPANQNDTYKQGDTISIQVMFSEAVTVTAGTGDGEGDPYLDFQIYYVEGQDFAAESEATYSTGTGTNTLTFTYTVALNKEGIGMILRRRDALILNGGRIHAGGVNIGDLGNGAVRDQTKVDGKPPRATVKWKTTDTAPDLQHGAQRTIFTVEFDFREPVSGFEEADILLENTAAQVEVGSLAVDATDPNKYTAKIRALAKGEVHISVPANRVTDRAGNENPSSIAMTDTEKDKFNAMFVRTPTVGTITFTTTGPYMLGDTITISVPILHATQFSGSPTLKLDVGGVEKTLTAPNVTGTPLLFSYTVVAGDEDTDGVDVKANSLTVAANTIKDELDNPLVATFATVNGGSTQMVNAAGPTVGTISFTSTGPYKAGDTITVSVPILNATQFSGSPTLVLIVGTTEKTLTATNVTASPLVFSYTVVAGDTDTDGVSVKANSLTVAANTIEDADGKDLITIFTAVDGGATHVVDTTAPTVGTIAFTSTGPYTVGNTITISVPITDTSAVTLATGTGGSPTLVLTVGTTDKTLTTTTDDGTITALAFSYTVAEGDEDADGVSVKANSLTLPTGATVQDAAGNDLATTFTAVNGGTSHTVDTGTPTVGTIAFTSTGPYTAGDMITISVPITDTSAVTLAGTGGSPTLTLVVGTTERTLTSSTTAGTITALAFSYLVVAADTDTDGVSVKANSLTLPSGTTIRDALSNDLVTTFTAVNGGTSQTVDNTAPTVGTIAFTSTGPYKTGDSITISVPITDASAVTLATGTGGAPTLTLVVGTTERTLTTTTTAGTITALTFSYPVVAADTDTDGVSVKANSLTLPSGTTVRDAVDLDLVTTFTAVAGGASQAIDNAAPTVGTITFTSTGPYTADDMITLSMPITDASDVTLVTGTGGAPTLTLVVGTTERTLTSSTSAGTITALAFSYTVVAADTDTDGVSVKADSLTLPTGTTIRDTTDRDLVTTFTAVNGGTSQAVDNTEPTVGTIAFTSTGPYKTGDTITISVPITDASAVTLATGTGGAPTLVLTVGTTDKTLTASTSAGTITALAFSYTVVAGDTDTDGVSVKANSLTLPSGTTVRDAVDLDLVTTFTAVNGGASQAIDNTAPTVGTIAFTTTGPYTEGDTITISVPIVGATQFSGSPTLVLTVGTTEKTLTATDITASPLVFTYTVVTGDTDTDGVVVKADSLTVAANTIEDAAGNDLVTTFTAVNGGTSQTVDNTPPTVGTIAFTSTGPYTAGNTITISVPITDASAVTLAGTGGAPTLTLVVGTTERTLTSSTSAGTITALAFSYTVVAADMDADGVSVKANSLTLPSGTTVRDAVDLDLVTTFTAVNGGTSHAVDNTAPTVGTISFTETGPYTAGDTITISVPIVGATQFSGSPTLVLTVGTTDKTLTATNVTASPLVFTYNVVVGDTDTDGVVVKADSLTVAANTIEDAAGNDLVTTFTAVNGGTSQTVDNTPPTVGTIAFTSTGPYTAGNTITISVPITDASAVTLAGTGGAPTLTLVVGTTEKTLTSSTSAGTITALAFSYTVVAGDTDTDGVSVKANSLTLPSGTTVRDAVDLDLVTTFTAVAGGASQAIDNTRPTVGTIAFTTTGPYTAGDMITLSVPITDASDVTLVTGTGGAPALTLVVGTTERTLTTTTTAGTITALTFSYLVVAADTDTDGVSVKANSLTLPTGTTIQDTTNMDLVTTFTAVNGGTSHAVDNTAPTVGTIAFTTTGPYTAGNTITISVPITDASAVTLAGTGGAPTLTLVVGTTERTLTSSTTAGTITALAFSYTVVAGDTDTDGVSVKANSLTLPSGTTVRDAVDLDLVTTFTAVNGGASQTVGTAAPTVGAISFTTTGPYTAGDTITISVPIVGATEFSGSPTLVLTVGTTEKTLTATNVTASPIVFSYTVVAGDTDTDGVVVKADSLTVAANTIEDAGGNDLVATFTAVNGGTSQTVDNTPPTVGTIAFTSTGPYTTGDSITISVPITDASAITLATGDSGAPTLVLTVGTTDKTLTSTTTAGTITALAFSYTVVAGDTDTDGVSVKANSLTLPSGTTVRDAVDLNLVTTFTAVNGGTSHAVDTASPTVGAISFTGTGPYTAGDTITISVPIVGATEFSGSPTLVLTVGTTEKTLTATDITASPLVFTYTVVAGDTDTDGVVVKADSLTVAANTIEDAAGNDLVTTFTAVNGGTSQTVDNTAPTVGTIAFTSTGPYTAGNTITISVPITDASDITLATGTGGAPTLTLVVGTTEKTLTTTTTAGTITALAFSYPVVAADMDADGVSVKANSLTLPSGTTVRDAVDLDLVMTFTAVNGGTSQAIDNTGPTVGAISFTGTGPYTAGDTITISVPIVGATQFNGSPTLKLDVGGVEKTLTAMNITASPIVFSYTVAAGDTDTDGVTVVANSLTVAANTIEDALGNDLVTTFTAVAGGTSQTVDNTAPTVGTITFTSTGPYTTGDTITISVPITDASAITLATGAGGSPTLTLVVGTTEKTLTSSTTAGTITELAFSYTVQAGDTDTDGVSVQANSLTLPSGTTIRDAVDLDLVTTFTTVAGDSSQAVDTTAPTVGTIAFTTTGPYKAGDSITISVPITDASDITLATGTGGAPTLTLVVNTTERTLTSSTTAGTITALAFSYTVVAGDTDTDGVSVKANSLALPSGTTVRDAVDLDLVTTFTAVNGGASQAIDNTAPTVGTIAFTSTGPYTAGDMITLSVPITDASDITLTTGGGGAPTLTLVVGTTERTLTTTTTAGTITALAFSYTVVAADTDTDGVSVKANSLTLPSGTTIRDATDQDLVTTFTAVNGGTSHAVDNTAPTVGTIAFTTTGPYTTGNTITISVPITDDSAVTLAGTGDAPTLTLVVGTTERTLTSSTSAGTITALAFSYTVQAGDTDIDGVSVKANSLTLPTGTTIRDAVDLNLVTTFTAVNGGTSQVVDTAAPGVGTISFTTTGPYTAGDTITISVPIVGATRFSGSPTLVLTVGTTDKTLTAMNITASPIVFSYTVVAGDTDTDGVVVKANSLTVAANTIEDASSNDLVATFTAVNGGASQTVDNTAPTVGTIAFTTTGPYKTGDTITISVPIRDASAVTLAGTGGAPTLTLVVGETERTLTSSTTAGTITALAFSYTVVAADTDTDGVAVKANSLTLPSGTTVRDAVDLDLVTTFTTVAGDSSQAVDTTAPTVGAIAFTTTGPYKAGDSITISVPITDASDITLATGAGGAPTLTLVVNTTERTLTSSTTAGTITALAFSYTVVAGDTDTDGVSVKANSLTLPTGTTIRDAAGNDLATTFTAVNGGTSQAIDNTAPTVGTIAFTSTGPYTAGDMITLSVPITDASDITLTTGDDGAPTLTLVVGTTERTLTTTTTAGTITALAFSYTVVAADTDTDGVSVKANGLTLPSGTTIRDATDLNLVTTFTAVNGGASQTVDTTAPTVGTIAFTSTGPYTAGDTITISVPITDASAVTLATGTGGAPTLVLTVGTTDKTLTSSTSAGTITTLAFSYMVVAADMDADGVSVKADSLTLPSGTTVRDAVELDLVTTFTAVNGGTSQAIDNTGPTVGTIAFTTTGPYTAGDTITISVPIVGATQFSGSPTLKLDVGGVEKTLTATNITASPIVFTYTVVAGDTDTDGVTVVANSLTVAANTIEDALGNDLVTTFTAVAGGTSQTVDTTAPTVGTIAFTSTGPYTVGNMITISVPITDASAITLATGTGGAPTLTLVVGNTERTLTTTTTAGTITALAFSYTVAAGDTDTDGVAVKANSLTLPSGTTIRDAVDLDLVTTFAAVNGGASQTVGTAAPTVGAIRFTTTGPYTAGNTITISVPIVGATQFSGSPTLVLTVGTTDKTLTATNVTASPIVFSYTVVADDTDTDGVVVKANSLTVAANTIEDAGGNDLVTTFTAVNGGASQTVDNTAPTVGTIAFTSTGPYKAGDTITISLPITDASDVTLATGTGGSPTLVLTVGTTDKTLTSTTSAGTITALEFSYTVVVGDTDTDGVSVKANSLTLPSGTTVRDTVDLDLVTTFTTVAGGASQAVNTTPPAVDNTAPTVGTIAFTSTGPYTAGDTITISVPIVGATQFSGSPTLVLTVGTTDKTLTATNITASPIVFSYTVVADDTDTDGVVVKANSLTVAANTIEDAGGNDLVTTFTAVNGGASQTVDNTAPTVGTIAFTSTGPYTTGDSITISVPITDASDITLATGAGGAPTLVLTVGTTDKTLTASTSAGTITALAFSYTVVAGDTDTDGVAVKANSLTLPSGTTVRDVVDLDLVTTFTTVAGGASQAVNTIPPAVDNTPPAVDNTPPAVDNTAPTVGTIAFTSTGPYKAGETITVSVPILNATQFSGSPTLVLIVGTTDKTLTATNVTASPIVFSYTVVAGDTDTDGVVVKANSLTVAADTIEDAAGNDLVTTFTAVNGGASQAVDTTAPTVGTIAFTSTGPYTAADTITISVPITDASDITLATGTGGSPTLVLTVGTTDKTLTTTTAAGTITTLAFSYTVKTGDTDTDGVAVKANSLTLPSGTTIRDAAGNDLVTTFATVPGGTTQTVDTTPPRTSGIGFTSTGPYTLNSSIDITVTFNEPVKVVDDGNTTQVPTVTLKVADANREAAYHSNTTNGLIFRYVIATTDANDADGLEVEAGSIALNGDSIQDTAGNLATHLQYASIPPDTVHRVDLNLPIVNEVAITSHGYYKAGDTIVIEVTLNKPTTITGTQRIGLLLGQNDTTPPEVAVNAANTSATLTTDPLVFRYTVQAGDTDADGVQVKANSLQLLTGTIVDEFSNPLAPGFTDFTIPPSSNQIVDTTAPTPVITAQDGNTLVGADGVTVTTVTIDFAEPVTDFAQDDIAATNGATLRNFRTLSAAQYTIQVLPSGSGAITVSVAAGAATDLAGNSSNAATPLTIATNFVDVPKGADPPPVADNSVDSASIMNANIGDFNNDGMVHPMYETGIIYANTEDVMITGAIENPTGHPITSVEIQYLAPSGQWQALGDAVLTSASEFEFDWKVTDFDSLIGADDVVMLRAVATNRLELTDAEPMAFSIKLDAGVYPPEVLRLEVDAASMTNPDSGAPQGMIDIKAYTLSPTGPQTVKVRFELEQSDGTIISLGIADQGDTPTDPADALQAALASAIGGTDASLNPDDYHEWTLTIDTIELADTITKDSGEAARDYTKDNNRHTIRAFAVSGDATEWPSDATTMLSVDNVDDVEPLGPTNITAIAKDGGVVEADPDGGYTLRGLVDPQDPSVVPQTVTLTIEPTAVLKTYESVMLVSVPVIDAALVGTPEEISDGVFEITVNIGELGIAGNGAYALHALAYDASPDGPDEMYGNVQTDESPESTIHVKNYLRPDPAVFKITKDLGIETNADSEGPQGIFTFTGYTIEQNSPPIASIRLEAKRANDADWTPIGTGDASTSVAIEDAALPGVLDHLVGIADDGTEVGNRSVVAIDTTYNAWGVSVDTRALGLEDTITKDSPGARDVSMDDNPYTVRAFAVDASGTEWPSGATEMFSLDNVDDVAPLGPTNVSVTGVMATENSVFEDAGAGSYTVGGLVDKYDAAVNSPVATFTVEPTAVRKTYASVRFVPGVEGLVITDVTETADGVFELTVDVGTLADRETYLENGTYMFHALAFDEFGNEQEDMSETDGSKISVAVANTRRPVPQVLAFTVGDPTQTNPDSGAPQGTIALSGYTPEVTSAPTTSVMFEVKRKNDTEWTQVGTAAESSPVTAADDAKLAAASVADVADVVGGNVVKSDTYQKWMIQIDTATLEDSIDKDNPGARDHTKDDNMYMVRATASATADGSANLSADGVTTMFSVDNVDDVAPLEPTNIVVTSVDGIETVFETAEDGSFTVGGLVDKYDDAVASPVATFTIEPVAERHTYESVNLTMSPEGALVGEITETEEGSGVFTVTVDVGTLADGTTYLENGTYTFQALAYDAFDNVEADTDDSKAAVTVANTYRPAPEVLAIAVDPESITQTNPDSGAPQGMITLNTRSYDITSPPISGMKVEVKRPSDEEWIDVGTATESMLVSDVSDAELADFVGDVAVLTANATEASDGSEATVVPIDRTYQEWMLEVDTATLEDTITAESPAARDASKDDNQYMVRVTAIAEADGSETLSADGITAHFSVDNVDDVSPVGPTKIVAVADVAGMIAANEDGSYTVGGIVDDTVPSPIAIFTTEPTADPTTYASVNLVQTSGDSAETVAKGEAGVLDLTIDVGLLENGTYMFHALAVDEFGNVQTDESPMITVHVLNFRVSDVTDITVIAVDGTDVAEPPTEPIPLRESLTVSFVVANGSLDLENPDHMLTGDINGKPVESESAEDPKMTFTLTVMKLSDWDDDFYTPNGVVTQRNGFVPFPLVMINLDNTGPMITIESPTEDETVESLPTIRATYHDGTGAGVDGATGSLTLARLQPPNEADVVVDQADLEKDAASLVYTRREPLAGGAYRVTVQVIDNLGNIGEGSAEFAVNGTAPTVAIHSPASGQTFEHGEPLISGEFSGAGTVEVTTFTINDVDATPEVDGNRFSYTPEEALANGDYTVVVAVTDGDGNMAQTSVVFVVDIPEPPKDTTPPVISSVAPTGLIKGTDKGALGGTRVSAVVTDEQSAIVGAEFTINGVRAPVSRLQIAAGTIEAPINLTSGPGLYTVRLKATSEGGTTEHVWTFTFAIDDVAPTISSITPNGTIRAEHPTISVSATDESGIEKIRISVFNGQNLQVKGSVENDAEGKAGGITRADFIPENPLTEGTYLILVDADDTLGNTATARGSFTIDFDTAAPIITMASPHQNARFILKPGEKAPTVSIAYADAESSIDVDSITLVIEGVDADYKATPSGTKITLSPEQKSASQVMHPLLVDTNAKPETWAGEYVVRFEVADKAHLAGYVSAKNKGTREANRTVHTFSFFLEAAEGPIMAARPLNYPNPFKDNTHISFSLARQATVSIVIYDATLRPVRVLVDNRVFDAGNYTLKENGSDAIGWDGTSSSGEDLARGIYFCEIIVADGFEPEYAILKLALTR